MTEQKKTLYIAEDHAAIRELFCMHPRLTARFDVVGQSGIAAEAADDCVRLDPDLLLLDLKLAGGSGFDVMKRLADRLCRTKTVVFSCSSDGMTVRRARALGAFGFVEKNAPSSMLWDALEAVAEGTYYFSDSASVALSSAAASPAEESTGSEISRRERQVLEMAANGMSNKDMANAMSLSVKTVENHRHSLMKKLGARNAADLAREAYRRGLLESA